MARHGYESEIPAGFLQAFELWRLPQIHSHLWVSQPSDGGPLRRFVSGPHQHAIPIRHPFLPLRITGIELLPGVASSLVGSSASLLVGNTLPLHECWGEEASALEKALSLAGKAHERIEVLSGAVQDRVDDEPRDPLDLVGEAMTMLEAASSLKVEDISKRMGIRSRHLHRLFTAHIGYSPKRADRIRRLSRVLSTVARGEAFQWSGIATDHKLADQRHLIMDFREMLGEHPHRFLNRHGDCLYYLDLGWLLVPKRQKSG